MVSKSKELVLRIAGALNGLFAAVEEGDEGTDVPSHTSSSCCLVAIDFVKCCIDHALFLSGELSVLEDVEISTCQQVPTAALSNQGAQEAFSEAYTLLLPIKTCSCLL